MPFILVFNCYVSIHLQNHRVGFVRLLWESGNVSEPLCSNYRKFVISSQSVNTKSCRLLHIIYDLHGNIIVVVISVSNLGAVGSTNHLGLSLHCRGTGGTGSTGNTSYSASGNNTGS